MHVELIASPAYWQRRIREAPADAFHHSIFKCNTDQWRRIEEKHREILANLITPTDSILDAGCGYGRLLTLMPPTWTGTYYGVDLSPDFIDLARDRYPTRSFFVGDLRALGFLPIVNRCEWAVLISIRPMVKRNLGDDVWAEMEEELRRVARKLLYLEYDPGDGGHVE